MQCVRSKFSECGVDGVAALGGARLELEHCHLAENGANGLYVRGGGTRVHVSGCRMYANGWQGAAAARGGYLHVFNRYLPCFASTKVRILTQKAARGGCVSWS